MLKSVQEVFIMKKIRPVSDLRNNFSEISKIVHETAEPVFLTKTDLEIWSY